MCDTEEFNLFLANLEEFVFDEDKIVSINWLSRTLDIQAAIAKKLLSTFINDASYKSKLSTTWFLLGTAKGDPTAKKILIVPYEQLESARERFDKITSEHIYSIQKSRKGPFNLNTMYLADQMAEKSLAQCASLSNIMCDHVKVVENARSRTAETSGASKPANVANKKPTEDKTSRSVKKSPVKNALGNMFSKKTEEVEKQKSNKEAEAKKKKEESTKKQKEESTKKKEEESTKKKEEKKESGKKSPVKTPSPTKRTNAAGKKKGADKGAGSAAITSFFSKGPLPDPKKSEASGKKSEEPKKSEVSSKKSEDTKTTEKTNRKDEVKASRKGKGGDRKKEEEREAMEVDETDENREPEGTENVNTKRTREEATKETNLKNSRKPSKSSKGKKTNKHQEKETQQRRRIQVFSDSSESEEEESSERERSPSPPPPSPPRLNLQSDDEDDVIPPTPVPLESSGGGRKRKRIRKLVTKTMTDEAGFLRTVKEFETVSCSDDEPEVVQDAKKPKVDQTGKNPPAKANQKSPAKTKQTSILSFFKKS